MASSTNAAGMEVPQSWERVASNEPRPPADAGGFGIGGFGGPPGPVSGPMGLGGGSAAIGGQGVGGSAGGGEEAAARAPTSTQASPLHACPSPRLDHAAGPDAAAGGVGLMLCQWAKHLGATVIGTVSTDEKAALATAHGCDHCILYRSESFVDGVREITDGRGVPVVYDSVGKDTFYDSLDCLQRLGLMVTFGNSSGAVEPFPVHELTARGSLFLTRPTLATYTATREDLEANTKELFDVVASGAVKVGINQTYPLAEAAAAHTDLEGRRTTAATVLLP